MRKMLIIPIILFYCFTAYGQKNPPDKSLVAWFPFNGNAEDASGSKLKSRIYNAVLTADLKGKENGSFYFNGANAYIEVKSTPSINLTESLTISCWIAPENKGIYKSWVSKANRCSQWRFGFGDVSSNEWGFGNWNKDRADYYTTLDSIPSSQWSFVAATFSQKAKKIVLYLNGKQIESFDIAFDITGSELPLYIGYQKDDCTWFNGNIDEVKIFNRALEPNEIGSLYAEFEGKISKPVFPNKSESFSSQAGLSDYINQIDPGTTAVRFAPQYMCTNKTENSAPCFSPDMKEVYWTIIRREGDSIYQEIMVTKKVGNNWTEPQRASFSSGNKFEGYPKISADGKKLYIFRGTPIFQYGMPGNCKIICYTKVNNEWVNPQEVADGIYASVTKDGTIYCNSLDMKTLRITQKNGVYSKPDTITRIAYPAGQNYQFQIAPDESYMFFTLRNAEVQDLYITFYNKQKNIWSVPAPVEAINTPANELFSGLSPDGKFFFFVRRTPESSQDIFWVSSDFVNEMKKNAKWGK
ncbi:MAG: LamG domain-containing protein [Bacteroidota bacterium]